MHQKAYMKYPLEALWNPYTASVSFVSILYEVLTIFRERPQPVATN
jgi:hypothetical protein